MYNINKTSENGTRAGSTTSLEAHSEMGQKDMGFVEWPW